MTTSISKRKRKPFRYVLPINATSGQKSRFRQDITKLKRPDSKWAVYYDWKQPGEAESYIIIPKGQYHQDKAIYAGIRLGTTLKNFNQKMN
ncbi:MAG: hypothetical protein ACLFQP_06720 [Halothece sp.]